MPDLRKMYLLQAFLVVLAVHLLLGGVACILALSVVSAEIPWVEAKRQTYCSVLSGFTSVIVFNWIYDRIKTNARLQRDAVKVEK